MKALHHVRKITNRTRVGIWLALCLIALAGLRSSAANYYVRGGASGSGNGSDWNNAWTDVTHISWSSIHPGDNIWVAGGSYGTLLIGASGATNQPIYIARVRTTNSIPTSAAGWSASYDSQVVVTGYHNYGSYNWITLDGQVPYTGILVTNTSLTGVYLMDNASSSASYTVTKNVDIGGPCTTSTSESGETRCFNSSGNAFGNYFGYCLFHNAPTLFSTVGQNNFMVEHCKFYSNLTGCTSCYHPNVWQTLGGVNVTMRYCEVYNWQAEGIMMDFVSSSDSPNVNWYIYDNVWHDAIDGNTGGSARIVEAQYKANGPVYLFNNTFVGMVIGVNLANGGSWNSANASTNNIYFQTGGRHGFGVGNDDYDLSDQSTTEAHGIGGATSAIFANFGAQNYHIVTNIGATFPRGKGATLPPQYATDFAGNIQASPWDIGAYTAIGGGSLPNDTTPPTVSLTSPASGATVSNLVALAATATDNSGGSGVASVTFMLDGTPVATDTAAPYTYNWNSLTSANGTHSLKATAVDFSGNQATSAVVTVTLANPPPDTTPPTVSVTAPGAGSVISNSVTLTANATDNVGGSGVASVSFAVDGFAVGTVSSAPYSIVWNSSGVINGPHTIQATAHDLAGNQGTSSGVAVTVQNAPITLGSGLVGYWKFDETSGTTAADSSGNGNTGTLVGDAAHAPGLFSEALSLDGGTGYARVPSTPGLEQISTVVSISAWVKFNTNIAYNAGDMQTIARKVVNENDNSAPPYSAYDLVVQDFGGGTFKARMGVTRASDSTRGLSGWGNSHTYGSWYYIVGVYDGTTVHLYVNGVEEVNASFSGTILQTAQPLCIGRYGTAAEPVNGLIDDFRLYNRVLAPADIQTLYNAAAPPAPLGLKIQSN